MSSARPSRSTAPRCGRRAALPAAALASAALASAALASAAATASALPSPRRPRATPPPPPSARAPPPQVVNVTPRYAKLRDSAGAVFGWENLELISDRPFETMLAELRRLKQEYPDRVLIASIMEEVNQWAAGLLCAAAGWRGWAGQGCCWAGLGRAAGAGWLCGGGAGGAEGACGAGWRGGGHRHVATQPHLSLPPPPPACRNAWEEIVGRCEEVGVDAFEINFSCPHGMPERRMGMAMGQDCELLSQVGEGRGAGRGGGAACRAGQAEPRAAGCARCADRRRRAGAAERLATALSRRALSRAAAPRRAGVRLGQRGGHQACVGQDDAKHHRHHRAGALLAGGG